MNLPNILTLLRIFSLPVLSLMFIKQDLVYLLFCYVFGIMIGITDCLDGYLARKYKSVTTLGMFLDPLADKIFILFLLLYFVRVDLISEWLLIVVLLRELAVTELRIFSRLYKYDLPANWLGKAKATSQYVLVGLLGGARLLQVSQVALPSYIEWIIHYGLLVVVWIVAVLTLWSLIEYVRLTIAKMSKEVMVRA